MIKRGICAILVLFLSFALVSGQAESLTIDGSWSEKATINADEPTRYYQIVLPSEGYLEVCLQSWMNSVAYKLWNADMTRTYDDKQVWYGSENEPANDLVSTIFLPAGSYLTEVARLNGDNGQFRLNASFKSAKVTEIEPNNGAANARKLSVGSVERGMLWLDDDYDYYTFTITEKQVVRLTFRAYLESLLVGLRDSEELEVRDADGEKVEDEQMWYGNEDEPATYVLERELKPGTYYVMIKKLNGENGIYEFSASGSFSNEAAAPSDEADGEHWYCPNCGTENIGNFCYNCGNANPRG